MASTSLTNTGTGSGFKTGTLSAWIKRSGLQASNPQSIWAYQDGTNNASRFLPHFDNASDKFIIYAQPTSGTGTEMNIKTNREFRDTSAWYHIVIAFDTTQATASDRVKLYINGVEETSFASSTYPSQNYVIKFMSSTSTSHIGNGGGGSNNYYFDGLMAHVHFTDGTAYAASDFGETESTSGIWKPKTAPSVTYGTNGFFLKFQDSSSLGDDSSGNTNDFTLSGSGKQILDTPSNVFATWNSLVPLGTFSNGNTVWTSASSGDGSAFSTLGAEAGKYYMECKITNANASGWELGVAPVTRLDGNANGVGTSTVGGVGYTGDGYIRRAGTTVSSGLTTFAQNDIISCALDMDNRKVYFYKNGAILNSGTGVDLPSTTGPYVFATGDWYSSASTSASANFGNGYFGTTAVASAENDDAGYGKFEYDVPAGYYALCTKNINTYG